MKKSIIGILMGLLVASNVFAQSQDYRNLLNKAKGYENSENWVYAMGTYYDAYTQFYPNSTSSEAYKGYKAIADSIRKGNPGKRSCSKSEMQGYWKALMAEYEKYWSENSANYISFEKFKKEASTAKNMFSLKMTFYRTEKYTAMKGVIENGYNKARQDSWSTPASWPLYSIYQDNIATGFKNSAYLMRYDDKNFSAGVVKLGEYVFYEVAFEVEDLNGKVIAGQQSAVLSSNQRFVFSDLTDDAAKKIQSGKCRIVLKSVNLLYGNISTTNGTSWLSDRNVKRKAIKLENIKVETPYGNGDVHDDTDDYGYGESSSDATTGSGSTTGSTSGSSSSFGSKEDDDDFYTATSGTSKPAESPAEKITLSADMLEVTGKDILMSKTEITQSLYEEIMGDNPSLNKGSLNPVENVSWFDALVFCNRLSECDGLTPVYSVNGTTDTSDWNYEPHNGQAIPTVKWNSKADGYRLPTEEEWEAAAKAGKSYYYSGSNTASAVAWTSETSGGKTHKVGTKAANAYGFYDMSGNVWEWCWNPSNDLRCARGGCYAIKASLCKVSARQSFSCSSRNGKLGFRIVCGKIDESSPSDSGSSGSGLVESGSDSGLVEDCEDDMVVETSTGLKLVHVPGQGILMGQTEITQELYKKVMGENPSKNVGKKLPVENVSFYDAIVFCNRLSELEGLEPVYTVNGTANTAKWRYTPHTGDDVPGKIVMNVEKNGYRLPEESEWTAAAYAKRSYSYSGSNSADRVAWYSGNSGRKTHEVAGKDPNGYGLYDMSGNVWEWTWTPSRSNSDERLVLGGSYYSSSTKCRISSSEAVDMMYPNADLGFRVVRYSRADVSGR